MSTYAHDYTHTHTDTRAHTPDKENKDSRVGAGSLSCNQHSDEQPD